MKKKATGLVILIFLFCFLPGGWPVQNVQAAEDMSLVVEGSHLVNKKGEIVQLKGASTHGIAWYPQYINKKAFQRLRDDWHANTIRLAMYTEEYGGYCSGGDQAALKEKLDEGVRYASELGMYVIIDWHILNDNNPLTHQKEAKIFFKEMAKKYKNQSNVLYELCNEPHGVSWKDDIRPYAKKLTKLIRKYDKDAVIIVGTNTWSQDVDEVIGNRLPDQNTVYALHFYAAAHQDANREKAKKALEAGIPLFVSECSITDASGNGNLDKASGRKWLSLLDKYHVSYICWSLSNKDESSALIKASCTKTYGWKKSQLSACGKWFRKQMRRNHQDQGSLQAF